MGWNPFSTAPRRRPSYAGSSYSSSSRHHSSTSRYKRSPRDSYMQHLYKKLQHFIKQIMRYAQRHPIKIFFMVIMPLVSGGVLTKLARQMGVNIPAGAGGAHGGRAGSSGGSGMGSHGGRFGDDPFDMDKPLGGGFSGGGHSGGGRTAGGGGMMGALGNVDLQSVAGGIGGLASLASMASKFM